MNKSKKFILALRNNNIYEFQNYSLLKAENHNLYIKNIKNNRCYIIDVTGKSKIKEIPKKSLHTQKTNVQPKKPNKRQYNPIYKNLEPYNTMKDEYYQHNKMDENKNNEKEEGANIFEQKTEETDNIPELGNIEKEDETKQKLGEKPPYEFDEEMKKELQELKEKQEEKIKEEENKKNKKNKKKSNNVQNKKSTENEESNTKKKKKKPQGWHLKKEYVDDDGNVFFKGVEQPHLKGSRTPTSQKENK